MKPPAVPFCCVRTVLIESLTLDREVAHLKDELMPRYAKLIYNGIAAPGA